MPHEEIPFYCQNIPREHWPPACPDFLLGCSEKDRNIIGTPDSAFERLTWAEVKRIIRENRLDQFQRTPSDLRKYRQFVFDTVGRHGSMMDFVQRQRLKWHSLTPRAAPFQHPDDIKILFNDWPYGIDPGIVHLVVWTKFPLKEDPATDDLTPAARTEINAWVKKTFHARMKPDHVAWFKNWSSIKSIHAIEHFHVMLYEPGTAFVEEITNGDVPQVVKVTMY